MYDLVIKNKGDQYWYVLRNSRNRKILATSEMYKRKQQRDIEVRTVAIDLGLQVRVHQKVGVKETVNRTRIAEYNGATKEYR